MTEKILESRKNGMLVLLDHAATGNSVEKCKQARDDMIAYLTEKK